MIPNIQSDANGNPTGFSTPRTDLLGGFTPLLNFAPDLLRLDVSVSPVSPGNRLGALGGDTGGFPNGRRLGDDVVDIYLRAAAGALVPGNITVGGNTTTRLEFLNSVDLGDGVDANADQPFLTQFPFVATPTDGVNPAHGGGGSPTSG